MSATLPTVLDLGIKGNSVIFLDDRGPMLPNTSTVGRQRLSTDSLGLMTLTLTNLIVGSRYRVEYQSNGNLAAPTSNSEGTATETSVNIDLNYYINGNANNNLRIKIRKGTEAPYYKAYSTIVTVSSSNQSVYIAQIPDN